jgi:hypothetical protein
MVIKRQKYTKKKTSHADANVTDSNDAGDGGR